MIKHSNARIVILSTRTFEDQPRQLQRQIADVSSRMGVLYLCRSNDIFLMPAYMRLVRWLSGKRPSQKIGRNVIRIYVHSLPFRRLVIVRMLRDMAFFVISKFCMGMWGAFKRPASMVVWMMHVDFYANISDSRKSTLIIDTLDHRSDGDKYGAFMKGYKTTGIIYPSGATPKLTVVPWGKSHSARIRNTLSALTGILGG